MTQVDAMIASEERIIQTRSYVKTYVRYRERNYEVLLVLDLSYWTV